MEKEQVKDELEYLVYYETFPLAPRLKKVVFGKFVLGANTFVWEMIRLLGGDMKLNNILLVRDFIRYTYGIYYRTHKAVRLLILIARGHMYNPYIPPFYYFVAARKLFNKWFKVAHTPEEICRLAEREDPLLWREIRLWRAPFPVRQRGSEESETATNSKVEGEQQ